MTLTPETRLGPDTIVAALGAGGMGDRQQSPFLSLASDERIQSVLPLIKLGTSFESQIYPGEIHFFRRDIVLRDAWRRAEDFFGRTGEERTLTRSRPSGDVD